MRHLLRLLLLAGAIPAALAATSPTDAQQNTAAVSSIRVTGDAQVVAKPERAQISVGVLSQEKQPQAAASQSSKQLDLVLAALRRLLGDSAEIKVVTLSLNPEYQYRPIGAKPAVGAYTASSVVRVTVDDLDKVGPVIDAATQAGANHVESVQYTVRDPQALRAQALHEAATRAKANAEALAAALNLRMGRVLTVEEVRDAEASPGDMNGPGRPPDAPEPASPTPDSFTASATVVLTVEVASR